MKNSKKPVHRKTTAPRPKSKPVAPRAKPDEPKAIIIKPPEPAPKKAPIEETPVKKIPLPELITEIKTEEKSIRALRTTEITFYEKEVADDSSTRGKIITTKQPGIRSKIAPKRTFFLKDHHKQITHVAGKPLLKAESERKITVHPPVRVKDISEKLGVKINQLIQKLMSHNIMVTINDTLSEEAIILIGLEFNYEIEIISPKDISAKYTATISDKKEDLVPRPPIVVVMGHVDHGKTTLLDKIRNTNVAATEEGLITQHIGASEIEFHNKKIVFLDTPGHQAFINMRARGANVTDIAVLVVAADDGVMPQTEEAIQHARISNIPIIVAINKVDKKDANLHKAKQQLASLDLSPEEWGGKTIFCEVSALAGQGIEHLLEMILLQAEILELRANPKRNAQGIVLETRLTENYGVVATCIVQNGTLRTGDTVACGNAFGKLRAMLSSKNIALSEAPPSTPVQIIGLSELPESGDKFYAVDSIQTAKEMAEAHAIKRKTASTAAQAHSTLENLFSRIEESKIKEVRLLLKADVHGSLEVLPGMLNSLSTNEIKVKIIYKGIGQINESDVLLADATDAIIIGFNVSPEDKASSLAKQRGIEIKTYGIIYKIVEELRMAMEGLLEPEEVEAPSGRMLVKNIFKISAIGTIAGCQVTTGKIERNCLVRVRRGKEIIHDGKIASLKRLKDDVREVLEGFECGIKIDGFDHINAGDVIEAYHIEKRLKKLVSK